MDLNMISDRNFQSLVDRVEKRIHQIQLYIHPSLFKSIYKCFEKRFEENKSDEREDKNKIFYNLKAKRGESRNKLFILKMKKPEDEFHTHFVIIQNPTVPFQKFLSKKISLLIKQNDFLKNKHPNYACCVYYVESPLDFHPKKMDVPNVMGNPRVDKKKVLDYIFEYLVTGLFFKFGRIGEHFIYEYGEPRPNKKHKCPTLYIGKRTIAKNSSDSIDWEINVRNKLHGIRVYYRPTDKSPEYIRFEYVANKDRIKRLNIRALDRLPYITADLIRPLDYITYREGPSRLPVEQIIKKFRITGKDEKSKILKARTMIHAHKSLISHRLYRINKDPDLDMDEWRERLNRRVPRDPHMVLDLVYSIDEYKEFQKKYETKRIHQFDYHFPKNKNKLSLLKSMVKYE